MQVHLSRTKRKDSVHQAVRRRLDTPRVPERHGRQALQARHEYGKTKPRLPRDFFDGEAPCASEMRLWEQKWQDRDSGTKLEIAREVSLHVLLTRLCSQMEAPPQSLHLFF